MKKKNLKALVDFSKIKTSDYLKTGAYHCASGEILAFTQFQIVCTEKIENDMMENLNKLHTIKSENLPNFVKDFNFEKTVDDFGLDKDKITVNLKDLDEKIKYVKKMFHARKKSYIYSGVSHELDGIILPHALIESYFMNNKNVVCLNSELLFDIAKIIGDEEVEVYFKGSRYPILVKGSFGSGMFLPTAMNKEHLDRLFSKLEKYGIKRIIK